MPSAATKLDHVKGLGADVVYLNPIHLAYTNHKYDALDFKKISPEFGTREDFRHFAREVHKRGMKVVLDGVFNHMGRNSQPFKDAMGIPPVHGENGSRLARSIAEARGSGLATKTCLN